MADHRDPLETTGWQDVSLNPRPARTAPEPAAPSRRWYHVRWVAFIIVLIAGRLHPVVLPRSQGRSVGLDLGDDVRRTPRGCCNEETGRGGPCAECAAGRADAPIRQCKHNQKRSACAGHTRTREACDGIAWPPCGSSPRLDLHRWRRVPRGEASGGYLLHE